MLDFVLLGTSGMCPLPNRALASCFVRVVDKGFLIDAGEGTQVELMRNKIATSSIDYVLITHMHADHISGLLGIFLAMQMQGRTNDLKIIGPKGIHNYINSFSPFIRGLGFKYNVEEIKSPTSYLIPVQSANLFINVGVCDHSVKCYCYNFILKRKDRFNIDNPELNELPNHYRSFLTKGFDVECNGKIYKSIDFLKPALKGFKFSYVTDTRPNIDIKKFISGADLAVIEGMYADNSKIDDAISKGHMTWENSSWLAGECKKFILTHYSPSLQITEEIKNEFKKKTQNGIIGYDGYHISIDYPKDDIEVEEKKKISKCSIPISVEKIEPLLKYYYKKKLGKVVYLFPETSFKYYVTTADGRTDLVNIYKSISSMKDIYSECFVDTDLNYFIQFNVKNNSEGL